MAYKGISSIVHLAAIPSPGQTSSSRQFQSNLMSTYNVLEAARKLNITNLVLASSETLIGIPLTETPPPSLPITEETPRSPHSAYSLSKLMGEHLADQYARWCPESKYLSLRFSNVMLQEEYASFEGWQKDPKARSWNCWGYIDARDGARAVELALKSDLKVSRRPATKSSRLVSSHDADHTRSSHSHAQGHEAFLIANNNTVMRTPSADLCAQVYPGVLYEAKTQKPNETVLCIEKARKMLGFEPQFDWK